MYKVSIVVPVHNGEQYLEETIKSILNQTMKQEEIQVIFVDDASTDLTSKIIKKYTEKHNNFLYFKLNNKSGSAGKPRNEGTKMATGKYIMYIDADDLLKENACQTLYKIATSKDADCVIANYINIDENGNVWDAPEFDTQKYGLFKIDMQDYKKSFFVLESAVWNKMYNLEFIKKNNLQFLEGMPAEDAYFCVNSFLESSNIYYTNEIVYYYRIRNSKHLSISNNCTKDYFDKYNKGYKAIYNKVLEYNNREFASFFFTKAILYIIYKFIDSKKLSLDEKIEVLKMMRWFYMLVDTLDVIVTEKYVEIIIRKIINEKYSEAVDLCEFLAEVRKDLPKEINFRLSEVNDEKYIQTMEKRK